MEKASFLETPTSVSQEQMESLSLQFRQEANRLIEIGQTLKEKLDWYMPLEDILKVPVTGEDADKFMASIENSEDVEVFPSYTYVGGKRLRNGLYLEIRPEHVRCRDAFSVRYSGAGVEIRILSDNTLRPQKIESYNRIFLYDPETDEECGTNIELIGRGKSNSTYGWREKDTNVMSIVRYSNHHIPRFEQGGMIETYNTAGQLISRRAF